MYRIGRSIRLALGVAMTTSLACGGTSLETHSLSQEASLTQEPCTGNCGVVDGTTGGSSDGGGGGGGSGGGGGGGSAFSGGRVTGGGGVRTTQGEVRFGMELRCDPSDHRHNLEITWGHGHHFHLSGVNTMVCLSAPGVDAGHPAADFNTLMGEATGTLDGEDGAVATFFFLDDGEPGRQDAAGIVIQDAQGEAVVNLGGPLTSGNIQAHN